MADGFRLRRAEIGFLTIFVLFFIVGSMFWDCEPGNGSFGRPFGGFL